MTKNKLLVTDIDGTILGSVANVPLEISNYLLFLYQQDWTIFFLTGRFFSYAQVLLNTMPFPYFLGAQNGSLVWSSEFDKILFYNDLSKDMLSDLEKFHQDARTLFIVESGIIHQDYFFRRTHNKDLKNVIDKAYFTQISKDKVVDLDEINIHYPFKTFSIAKFFGLSKDIEEIYQQILLRESIYDYCTINRLKWPLDDQYHILHITSKKASKGKALDRFISLNYEKKPFIMASGDDYNDLDLLQRADFKVVIDTAPQELINISDITVGPPDLLGVIKGWQAGMDLLSSK